VKNEIANSSEGDERRGPGPLPSLLHRTDLILAVVILTVCGVLYYVTSTFEKASEQMSQNIPPEWFPRLLLVFIAALTLVIPFEHLFHKKGKESLDEGRRASVKPIAVYSAAVLCAIVALMPWIGTFLSLTLVCVSLPLLWEERRWKILIPFAAIFPGLVTLLFTKVLGVYFVPGILAKLF
jgi:putative tricarboxylic transport membrane protein